MFQNVSCSNTFLALVSYFHENVNLSVNVSDNMSALISIETIRRKGAYSGTILFAIFFVIIFRIVNRNCRHGVYINYSNILNIRGFTAKMQGKICIIRYL